MGKVKCVGLIPAETDVSAEKGLNVLFMAANETAHTVEEDMSLFGAVEGMEKLLVTKRCVLAPGEHAHLYFHIPAECLSAAMWAGAVPDEMILFGGTDVPETEGKLIFIQ